MKKEIFVVFSGLVGLAVFPLLTLGASIKDVLTQKSRWGFSKIVLAPLYGVYKALSYPFHAHEDWQGLKGACVEYFQRGVQRPFPDPHLEYTRLLGRGSVTWTVKASKMNTVFAASVLAIGAEVEGVVLLPFAIAFFGFAGLWGRAKAWGRKIPIFGHIGGALVGLVHGIAKACVFPFQNSEGSWQENRQELQVLGEASVEVDMHDKTKQKLQPYQEPNIKGCTAVSQGTTVALARKRYDKVYGEAALQAAENLPASGSKKQESKGIKAKLLGAKDKVVKVAKSFLGSAQPSQQAPARKTAYVPRCMFHEFRQNFSSLLHGYQRSTVAAQAATTGQSSRAGRKRRKKKKQG